jgi:thiamine-monophosphate kinase
MSNAEDKITAWFAEKSTAGKDAFPIGIGDDMAQAIVGKDASVLITTDMLLEGVHFQLDRIDVAQAGYKAMAVSLSDCAAMATVPLCAVVSVALPAGSDPDALKQLHAGLTKAADAFNCTLIGGDITAWRREQGMVINSTIISIPCKAAPVRRSGAKPGDVICVTGSLGGSLKGKHATFTPRVFEAIRMAETVTINSMMDISDGLSSDLNRICAASGAGALLDAQSIPISDDVPAGDFDKRLAAAINDGEDFELLFTLTESEYEKLIAKWDMPVAITKIGVITDSDKIEMQKLDGTVTQVTPAGFDHL